MAYLELIQQNPRTSLLLLSALVSLFISIVNYFMLDKERMREIKKKQKELQGQIKQHQKDGNHDKAMELQKEMLTYAGETMKHSFKPMIITLIPILLFFSFIKNTYASTAIASSWFWWYLGGAIASSIIFRKIFRLP